MYDVQKLEVVDVVDGVVRTEDAQVFLDTVVDQRALELTPKLLHHVVDLVFSGKQEQESQKYNVRPLVLVT